MKNDIRDNLEYIEQAFVDTIYILDDSKPCLGIKKTLKIWFILFFVYNAFFYIYYIVSANIGFFASSIYIDIYRVINILFNTLIIVIYFLSVSKIEMSVKEKDFLKGFSIYPILISIFKSLDAVVSFVNLDFMMLIYNSIPFDLIISLIAIFQLYRYFKDKKIKYISMFLIVGLFLILTFKVFTFQKDSINFLSLYLRYPFFETLIDDFVFYSVLPICSFGLTILFIRSNNERKYLKYIKNI